MKTKLFLGLSLMIGGLSFAQTDEQRLEIKKTNNTSELNRLELQFQAKYQIDEIAVATYLSKNPSLERTFTKNGSVYFLQKINNNGNPIYINTKSNIESGQLIKANSLYNGGSIGANITGTGMVAGVWDGGQVRATHELLVGKASMQTGQTVNTVGGNNHMTHVSGTIVGKDIGNSARGIAYNATAQCNDWTNDITEMTAFANAGFLISNHSYGMGNGTDQDLWTFGAYNDTAFEWDQMLKNAPNYLPFVAVGNEQTSSGNATKAGFDIITGSSSAKNVMTVGAVNANRSMSDYSNWGPTDDGRVKPNIVTRGTGINSSQATSDTAYSGSGDDSSGTSYASPAAAAGALLLQQYYFSLKNSYMSAAMLKALILHTADDAGLTGPDYKFGWGIMNVERAAQIIQQSIAANGSGGARMINFTNNPTNNSLNEISPTPSTLTFAGTEAKVSICWTDDEGVEQTTANGVDPTASRLVYNFDILFSQITPSVNSASWNLPGMVNRTTAATKPSSASWFTGPQDNYKQAIISATTTDSNGIVYIRKSSSSPATTKPFALIVSGLKIIPLGLNDVNAQAPLAFFNKLNNKLQLISIETLGFGKYQIYDVSGKLIDSSTTSSNEISFENHSNGVYIIKFENKGKTATLKFIK